MNLRFLIILVAAIGCSPRAVADTPPLNVLVIVADDLGVMDVGCYNPHTFYETPNLDRLAHQGARFTNGYAANPVCSPTRYSIMTGRYPTRAGLTNWLPGVRNERFLSAPLAHAMEPAETTLAELLKPAGYATAFVGKWHLGESPAYWPEAQGFDINIGGWSAGHPASYFSPYKNPRLEDGPPGENLTERLADETTRLLERFKKGGTPFYLQLSLYDVHTPLQAPQALIDKYTAKASRLGLKDQYVMETQYMVSAKSPRNVRTVQGQPTYAAMVESMDTAVGRVLAKLDSLGLADNTLVIFTSDNGGLSTAEGLPTSNLPYRGGKGWVYEGGIKEPFIIRLPAAKLNGRTVETPVMSTDIFTTALAAAGQHPPAGLAIDGMDLLPLLRGDAPPARDALYWHYPHYSNQGGFPGGAIRRGDWKLIENYEDGSVALYNLNDDPGEQVDRASKKTPLVGELRENLHSWYQKTGARFLGQTPGGPAAWSPEAEIPKPSATKSHAEDSSHILPAGSALLETLQSKLATFEKTTGIRVLVRFHPKSPSADEDAKPGAYMRSLATQLGVANGGVLAVYFADEPDWRLWIGDELTARFSGKTGTVAELTENDAIHDAKELLFAKALDASAKSAPENHLSVQTMALIDGLLARITPP